MEQECMRTILVDLLEDCIYLRWIIFRHTELVQPGSEVHLGDLRNEGGGGVAMA